MKALLPVILLLLAGCAEDGGYAMQPSGKDALIEYTMRPTVSPAGEVLESAVGLHEYLNGMQGKPDAAQYGDLVVNWSAKMQDAHGNKSDQRVIQLRFKNDDIQKIKFAEVSPQRLLNDFVVDVGTSKDGKRMLMDYCTKYGATSPTFCQQAATS